MTGPPRDILESKANQLREIEKRRARIVAAYKRHQAGRGPTMLDQTVAQAEIDAYAMRRADADEWRRKVHEEFRLEMEANKKDRIRAKTNRRHDAMKRGGSELPLRRMKEIHLATQEGKCAHCGTIFDNSVRATRPELDHKVALGIANNGDSRPTIDNTWLLCGTCHQAKTCIENYSIHHRLAKHRWKMVWLLRSIDGKWHLPELQRIAVFTCGPSCLKCRLETASYLIQPRQLSYTATLPSGVYLDAVRFYELIGDRRWVRKLKLMLVEQGACPECDGILEVGLSRHIELEHPKSSLCPCRWCGMVFRSRTKLASHMESDAFHPNVCRPCDRAYADLARHEKRMYPSSV